jgi:hypothetical protein
MNRRDISNVVSHWRVLFVVALLLFAMLAPLQGLFAASLIVTNTNDSGAGSLRQAIADAAPGDTISFNLPANSTITLASELSIYKNLTINGPGTSLLSISGNNAVRILNIGATVNISGLTLTAGNNPGGQGGAIYMNDVNSKLFLDRSVVSNSVAGNGGGIYSWIGSTINVTNSTISGNTSSGSGGGIYLHNGTNTISNSLIVGNTSGGAGGGIFNIGHPSITKAIIINSTISGNTSASYGAGIGNQDVNLEISHSTIVDNLGWQYAGGINVSGGSASVKNTILHNPEVGDCNANPIPIDGGGNLSSDTHCFFSAATSANKTDPMLGPLADNGGPTHTYSLLSGSPAINRIPSADCVLSSDQRGAPRPQGAGCDSGAFEYNSVVPSPTRTPTITQTPSLTHTLTQTASQTATPTYTATHTPTASQTPSPTHTASQTASVTHTASQTPSPTASNTPSATDTASQTPNATATQTASATSESSVTRTATAIIEASRTATATIKLTATSGPLPSSTPSLPQSDIYLPIIKH